MASICDSEENRKKLAWLVPSYVLMAWFFCVIFQPITMQTSMGPDGGMYSRHDPSGDENYEVIYLDGGGGGGDVCERNGSVIRLGRGSHSALLIKLARENYRYRPFSCSIRVEADPHSLSGLAAVIEAIDLRRHEDDVQQPGGHWGSSVCVDYLEVHADGAGERNKLCGEWGSAFDERLVTRGLKQNLFGFCEESDCTTLALDLNVVIDARRELSGRYGLNLKKRTGFTLVVTGYSRPSTKTQEGTTSYVCEEESQFNCSNPVNSSAPGRCIWKRLQCDGHENCGYPAAVDESANCPTDALSGRTHERWKSLRSWSFRHPPWWSFKTMVFIMITYLAIIMIMIGVTMLFLHLQRGQQQTQRRPPSRRDSLEDIGLEAAAEVQQRGGEVEESQPPETPNQPRTSARRFPGRPRFHRSIRAGRNAGDFSMLVMFKEPGSGDEPPTYESIYSSRGNNENRESETSATATTSSQSDEASPRPATSEAPQAGNSEAPCPPPPYYNIVAVNLPDLDAERMDTLSDPDWAERAIAQAVQANPRLGQMYIPVLSAASSDCLVGGQFPNYEGFELFTQPPVGIEPRPQNSGASASQGVAEEELVPLTAGVVQNAQNSTSGESCQCACDHSTRD